MSLPRQRAIRPIATGRRNWLFAGADRGGRTAATWLTLIETARRNGLNPFDYLRHVLTLLRWPNLKTEELMPWRINATLARLNLPSITTEAPPAADEAQLCARATARPEPTPGA